MKAFIARSQERFDALDPIVQRAIIYLLCAAVFLITFFGLLAIPSPSSSRNCDPFFSYGEIQDGGAVRSTDFGIYTKKMIECTSFDITLDIGVQDVVTLHYYDAEGKWLASEKLEGGALVCKDYSQMFFTVGEQAVRVAGIRLSVKRNGTSIAGAERLTYAWNFVLNVSKSRPEEFFKAKLDFVLGEISDTGVYDTYTALRARSTVTKSIVSCTAFELVFDEPAKYDVVIHYYRLDQWLSCERLDSKTGRLVRDYDYMSEIGATGIRLSVSRDDRALLDLDDYFTPFISTFDSHVDLFVSQLVKSPTYMEVAPDLSYGRIGTDGNVVVDNYNVKYVSTNVPIRCLSFSIQLDDGGKYDACAYYYRLDEVSNSFVLVGSDEAGANGALSMSAADMAALGIDAVAFTFSRDDGLGINELIDYAWFDVQNFEDHFTLTVLR